MIISNKINKFKNIHGIKIKENYKNCQTNNNEIIETIDSMGRTNDISKKRMTIDENFGFVNKINEKNKLKKKIDKKNYAMFLLKEAQKWLTHTTIKFHKIPIFGKKACHWRPWWKNSSR